MKARTQKFPAFDKEAACNKVRDAIIEQLKQGAAPWVKPWKPDDTHGRAQPHNIVSRKDYRGINVLILMMAGSIYPTGAWGSYRQIKQKGGQVRKGETATTIFYFERKFRPDEKARAEGKDDAMKSWALLRHFNVFNIAQADWPDAEAPAPTGSDIVESYPNCAETVKAIGAVIKHGGDRAFFAPGPDMIGMPNRKQFTGDDQYYATLFHELTHWTGHSSRLDRKFGERFGNPAYAFEELVAELGAAFMCSHHGVTGELRHAGYIGHWIKALTDEPNAIFKAAGLAQRAFTLLTDAGEADEEQEQEAA